MAAREEQPRAGERVRRVMVVDDNEDAGATLTEVLCYYGYDARFCHSAADGMALAASFNPDICVSDIGMPGMDGYQFAQQLKQRPVHYRLKLIALTGYTSDKDKLAARKAGFDVHLSKPVVVELLIAAIGAATVSAPDDSV